MLEFFAAGTRVQSASATTLTPGLPSLPPNGGFLLAAVQIKSSAGGAVPTTATAGWTQVGTVVGTTLTLAIWKAQQGAAAPVFTWTTAAACAAQVCCYASVSGPIDAPSAVGTQASGTTNPHTSPSMNTTRDDSLMVYIDVASANTALATPAGWTENVDGGSATDAGRTVWGSKAVATSGTASGAISVTGAAANWIQVQIELRLSLSTALDFSKMELGAWVEPPQDQASFAKLELGAWAEPPQDALSISKMEVGAWLVPNDNELRFSKLELGVWLVPTPQGGRRGRLLFASLN